jgi:hypothetical protein
LLTVDRSSSDGVLTRLFLPDGLLTKLSFPEGAPTKVLGCTSKSMPSTSSKGMKSINRMLASARVASSSNSWSGHSKRTVSGTTRIVSERNFRQVSCLKVQSPRLVFVELPEQHIEILLSREQTQIDEGLFHLPLIQYPVDSEIHGADQQSSRPVRQLSAHTSTLHDGQGCMSVQLGIVQLGHSAVSGSFICILTRSCPCRTC